VIRPDLEKGLAEIGVVLSLEMLDSFELFASELKKWNQKINLTSICNDVDIAIKHMLDAIIFAECVNAGENVLDIGSGAGIPSIPLKIVKPEVNVTSVDAVGKKIMFQKHIAHLLQLKEFDALHARIESLFTTRAGKFDLITSRAFSNLEDFVAMSAPLLKDGGRIIAMKGPAAQSEIDGARDGLKLSGYKICSVQEYSLPMNKGQRCLVTISATKSAR
jgi:16S rRNA (guanine527-N7)-methyltransferase